MARGIVAEKETRLREGMRSMGMSDVALLAAWLGLERVAVSRRKGYTQALR